MPTTDDEGSKLHKKRAAKDRKSPFYCFRNTKDHTHAPKVVKREFHMVNVDNLASWPRMGKGLHVREYVECEHCRKIGISERVQIHESMIMYHITAQERPLLANRLFPSAAS